MSAVTESLIMLAASGGIIALGIFASIALS